MGKIRIKRIKPIVVYCGSMIQQNHGEEVKGHGYNEWDVESKTFKFHELENEYGLYTIKISGKEIPDTSNLPRNVRLRLFTGGLDESEIKQYVATLKAKHNIIECSITRPLSSRFNNGAAQSSDLLDVNDVNYQNKLLVDYVKSVKSDIEQPLIDKVVAINKEINASLPLDDAAKRIVWIPKTLKFDNLFTYGEGNWINFDTLQGSVGLFAPNASGKSSIPDAICFALYDKTPRTIRAVNIMNTRKDTCFCEFVFVIGDVEYTVQRTGKRNKKGEVKIDVDFWCIDKGVKTSLNGEERRVTNEYIRQYVGDFDDFLLTAFSVQDKNSLFIDRGQSDRKDVLSQFMGLQIFDRLHDAAKDASKEVMASLKQFKNEDFTDELVEIQAKLDETIQYIAETTAQVTLNTSEYDRLNDELQALYEQKIPITVIPYTVEQLDDQKAALRRAIDKLRTSIVAKNEIIQAGPQVGTQIEDIDTSITGLQEKLDRGITAVQKNTQWIADNKDRITERVVLRKDAIAKESALAYQVKTLTTQLKTITETIGVLANHEYDPNCKYCCNNEFVKNATASKAELPVVQAKHSLVRTEHVAAQELCTSLEDAFAEQTVLQDTVTLLANQELAIEKLKTRIAELETSKLRVVAEAERAIQTLKDAVTADKHAIEKHADNIVELDAMIATRVSQDADILTNAKIGDKIVEIKTLRSKYSAENSSLNALILSKSSTVAVLESKRHTILEKIKVAKSLAFEHMAYELYLAAVCRDGLPYQLVADIIPVLETDVNNILSQLVDFAVLLDVDGKNINGRIVYAQDQVWPLELASGMEKFISSLAIRVALMRVSLLPKSNFLIIDEGFGALDTDNRSSLHMLFSFLKTQFEFLLIISHLDSLRDVTDSILEIKRDDRYSTIYVD